MHITSFFVLGCAILSSALTPAQISQRFDDMIKTVEKNIDSANGLDQKDAERITSQSSGFQQIIRNSEKLMAQADDISEYLEGLPSRYQGGDSTTVADAYIELLTKETDFFVALASKSVLYPNNAEVCSVVLDTIVPDNSFGPIVGGVKRLASAVGNKVSEASPNDLNRVGRATSAITRFLGFFRRNWCP